MSCLSKQEPSHVSAFLGVLLSQVIPKSRGGLSAGMTNTNGLPSIGAGGQDFALDRRGLHATTWPNALTLRPFGTGQATAQHFRGTTTYATHVRHRCTGEDP